MENELLEFNQVLTREPLFSPIEELYSPFKTTTGHKFTRSVSPSVVASGEYTGNNIVHGYLKSSNFITGTNGWKFDGVGNLEANSATIRGSIYASSGLIGGWVVDDNGLYYDGTGTPNIRTAATVGSGANGVLLDSDGIKVYDSVLGIVVNLPSDGSPPSFASGTINETTFEISTNAVLRTSSTVGDGSEDSAGVLINNSGIYACEANQSLDDANVRIPISGNPYFSGIVNSSQLIASWIQGSYIEGTTIVGATIKTALTGQRLEIDSEGMKFMADADAYAYGDETYTYGDSDRLYGTGVLAYFNSTEKVVPIYIQAEQDVADIHLPNRSSNPTGDAEDGDLCVVDGKLMIYNSGWELVGEQTS